MRDFTTTNYCECFWIRDILNLKQNDKKGFTASLQKNKPSTSVSVDRVTIFGTIVEIKPLGTRGFVYHVDDGTGVIACKHSDEQFDEIIGVIESEQHDILNQTFQSRESQDQSSMVDSSMEDSIFNDKSIQNDEDDINKRSQLMCQNQRVGLLNYCFIFPYYTSIYNVVWGRLLEVRKCNNPELPKEFQVCLSTHSIIFEGLQSIWDSIYESFSNLMRPYLLGDVVLIQGKLYSYYKVNQIYVNTIRPMDLTEEITRISVKLEDGVNFIQESKQPENRLSGLMTFDHIDHLNPQIRSSRDIKTPIRNTHTLEEEKKIVTPHLESTLTFDTLESNG